MKYQPAPSRPLRSSLKSLSQLEARLRARMAPAPPALPEVPAPARPVADEDSLGSLPRAPRRRSPGRAWAWRAATGRSAGRRAGRPGLYL